MRDSGKLTGGIVEGVGLALGGRKALGSALKTIKPLKLKIIEPADVAATA